MSYFDIHMCIQRPHDVYAMWALYSSLTFCNATGDLTIVSTNYRCHLSCTHSHTRIRVLLGKPKRNIAWHLTKSDECLKAKQQKSFVANIFSLLTLTAKFSWTKVNELIFLLSCWLWKLVEWRWAGKTAKGKLLKYAKLKTCTSSFQQLLPSRHRVPIQLQILPQLAASKCL